MSEKKLNTVNEEEKKKKKKKLLIILGCVLGAGAVAGAGVGIYYAVKPSAPVEKEVTYETFREAVDKAYDFEAINEKYSGKIQHGIGEDIGTGGTEKIEFNGTISGAYKESEGEFVLAKFSYERGERPQNGCDGILNVGLIDSFEKMVETVQVEINYYISNNVYSMYINIMDGMQIFDFKFNEDMAIIHFGNIQNSEMRTASTIFDVTYSD